MKKAAPEEQAVIPSGDCFVPLFPVLPSASVRRDALRDCICLQEALPAKAFRLFIFLQTGKGMIIEPARHFNIHGPAGKGNRHNDDPKDNSIKTTLRYLHVTNRDLSGIISPLDDLKLK